MISRRRSIAFPVALLLVMGMTIVMGLSTLLTVTLLVAMRPEERVRIGPYEIARLLRSAVTHDGAGNLKLDEDILSSSVLSIARGHPSFWYVIRDGRSTVSSGQVPPLPSQASHDSAYQLTYSEFMYSHHGQHLPGVSVAAGAEGGISIETGGIAFSVPEAVWVLLVGARGSGLYHLLALVLFATATAATLIVKAAIARPVKRVVVNAEQIDAIPNGRLLPDDRTPTELLPMVVAFNTALQRIDAAFESQRSFLSNAAHELRTPLTRMRLKLELIQDDKLRGAVVREAAHLASVIRTLLQLARLSNQALETAPVDLVAVGRAMVAEHALAALEQGIELAFRTEAKTVVIQGSESAIRAALSNLLLNAIQHATGTRQVTLAVALPSQVSVVDHGPGVAQEDRAAIFRPFVRGTTTRTDGTGLGLAIVMQVMATHGGAVWLEDTLGGGATVLLTFPAGQALARPLSKLQGAAKGLDS